MEEEYKKVQFQYGFVLLRTKRFQSIMDRLGAYRISKPVGWILLYLIPFTAGLGLYLFLTTFSAFFSPRVHDIGTGLRGISPIAYLGLPGLNPYIPFIDGWIALLVAMVIHEGAHGVIARSLGFPVKTSGLIFFLVIPFGAFVEVDEDALKAGRARDSGRILAAGASVNILFALVTLLALFAVVSTMTPAANGVAITQIVTSPPSPASIGGLKPGDIIVSVNGIHYNNTDAWVGASWYKPGQTVTVGVWEGGQIVDKPITLASQNVTVGGKNVTVGYFGISGRMSLAELQAVSVSYANPSTFFAHPFTYVCIPTFPRCETVVPFSDQLSPFYTSSYGASLVPIAGLLFWLFFLNFNLAVFNALPIYPLDGGQAFRAGLKGLVGARLSEKGIDRVTLGVTLAVVFLIASFPLAAYLSLI